MADQLDRLASQKQSIGSYNDIEEKYESLKIKFAILVKEKDD